MASGFDFAYGAWRPILLRTAALIFMGIASRSHPAVARPGASGLSMTCASSSDSSVVA